MFSYLVVSADQIAKPTDQTTSAPDPSPATDANPDTTYISGSITYTGAAAVSAAEFAKHGDHEEVAKHGMSSFAIIGKRDKTFSSHPLTARYCGWYPGLLHYYVYRVVPMGSSSSPHPIQ